MKKQWIEAKLKKSKPKRTIKKKKIREKKGGQKEKNTPIKIKINNNK